MNLDVNKSLNSILSHFLNKIFFKVADFKKH